MPTETKASATNKQSERDRLYEVGGRELTAEQAVALLWRYKKALEGLTVGGSEFVNDPEFCLVHINGSRQMGEKFAYMKGYKAGIEAAAKVVQNHEWIGQDELLMAIRSLAEGEGHE